MEHLHPRASSQPWKAIGLAVVMAAPSLLASRASAQADAPQTTPATQAAQPDKPAVKTVILQATKNGCVYQLENPNTDDERLVIVKDDKRNEFPTLKEAEVESLTFYQDISDKLTKSRRGGTASWFSNGELNPETKTRYEWRLKGSTLAAETAYQMAREALLLEDSSGKSLYLQRYMVGHARHALNTKLPQSDRLQSTMRLVFHAFADMRFSKQDVIKSYIRPRPASDSDRVDLRTFALIEGVQACIDAHEGTPKFMGNPEAVGQKILDNFSNNKDIRAAIDFYKKSNRKGYNYMAAALERAYKPPVKRPASPAPKR